MRLDALKDGLRLKGGDLGARLAWLGRGRLSARVGNENWPYTLRPGASGAWILSQWHRGKRLRSYQWLGQTSPVALDPAALAGHYRDPGGHWSFQFLNKRGRLYYRDGHPEGRPDDLTEFLAPDKLVFNAGGGYFRIEKDRQRRVTALLVEEPEGRIKRLRCKKV